MNSKMYHVNNFLMGEALIAITPTTSTSNIYRASLVYLVSINLLKFSSSFRHCCRLFVVLCRHLEATELGKRSPSYTAPTQLVTAGDAPKQYSSDVLRAIWIINSNKSTQSEWNYWTVLKIERRSRAHLATLTFYAACAVRVTIFSTRREIPPVSIFTCSYMLLL